MRFPEYNFSVILFCHLSTMVPLLLSQQVSDIYLGDKMASVQPASGPAASVNIVPADSSELSLFTGFFRDPDDELIRQVIFKNKKLLYIRNQNSFAELAHIGESKFRMLGIPTETSVVFTRTESGK